MLKITSTIFLHPSEMKITFIASPGPGGQNVNKLATAVQLRFNVHQASLPEAVKERLIKLVASKLSHQGDLIIKASRHRTQERNKQDAINRLITLIKSAAIVPKKRRKTKPTFASVKRHENSKKLHSTKKTLRRNTSDS